MDQATLANSDNILSAFTAQKCTALHKQKHNCQPAGTVPWACFAERNAATASLRGTVLKLFCNHELSSCKLFGTVPWLFCAFTTHTWTGLHQQKQQLPTSWYCTMRVFAVPGARTVKHMVLGWNCVAIMNSTAANCLTLYLACFAVRNSTANCSVMLCAFLDHIPSAFTAYKCTIFTQTKTTTANQLVLYHECVSQNELQQLQAYVVMYWDCFETAACVLPFTFVLQELTNPTVCFCSLSWLIFNLTMLVVIIF